MMRRARSPSPPARAARPALLVLGWPLALAALQLAGLVLGLTGGGWRDALSAVLVGLSILIFALRRRLPAARPPARKTRP